MSTTTKGLPNACPTCLALAGEPCTTASGVETNAHSPRARGEWPQILCHRPSGGHERPGERCPLCGHTNLVHPQRYANPALKECAVCALLRHG